MRAACKRVGKGSQMFFCMAGGGWVGEEIHFRAAARSFLHHQVRSMVGTLVQVGNGRWRPEDVKSALVAKDRQALGLNAPPEGLYFVEAIYP